MTVFYAKQPQPPRRKAAVQAIGLAVGLLAGLGAVNAAAPSVAPAALAGPAADPARQVAGALAVDTIDFKRGESGAGRLILRFSGDGAMPDLKTQGAQVLINVANAQLPANLQRPINVADFATPVERIEARPAGQGTQLVLATRGGYQSMAYQTGREYVVEIAPRAAAAAATAVAGAAAAANAPAAGSAPRYTGRPVTFNFQDVPVRTVLQLIAEESNLNIVASDTVQGNVTLRLINVPWDQALDIVLQAKGLDKRRSGSVVWVAPQSEIAKFEQDKEDARIALDNRVDLVTEYIQINYHNAAQIYKALTEAKGIGGSGGSGGGNSQNESGFLSGRGRLVADERTNTLMISDIPKKVEAMKELIRVIDRPVDQVLIEARVVIASETFAREIGAKFGINGATGKPGDRSSLGFGSTTDISGANASARAAAVQAGRSTYTATRGLNVDLPAGLNDAAGSLALSILNAGYMLDLELSALQEEGRGEVISNPRIVTSNQREAVIRQGQEVGYVTITPSQGGGSIPIPNVQFKDVLLELKVTPTITSDGRVFLNMAVKKDEVIDFVDTSIGDVPLINKREVNTAVLVEDGQTVVVGGVYEFRDRSDLSKVPFLGDIPFLGNFFKKRGRSKEKAELLIFVTPKVMRVAQR
ncbi:type IV pilus secretin PilQ [Vulcaniibacterium thermophilum]|jgi:type IV pilus assembly protein PilQ|uniref:Fimbrial protein n=1 Tax=Vulcaniibacterium thermophilum TaxID=1169913 RepID=A0A918YZA0_9GAMM|nr:type IV pilus secretin PilQ family protein [Vulcaniibacterium thermophilum]GHE30112.1 fimbrial protein [Vulcaniibacterium thermophilum]